MRARAIATAAATLMLAAGHPAPAAAAARPAPSGPRAVLFFIPPPRYTVASKSNPSLLQLLDRERVLSGLGIVDATQGNYNEQQALLDMTQGARVSQTTYAPQDPPPLPLVGPTGSARVTSWQRVLARAKTAPGDFKPGLLASLVPGGAGYVDVGNRVRQQAVVAADRNGSIAATSAGSKRNFVARVQSMVRRKRFVVVDLPRPPIGLKLFEAAIAERSAGELVMLMKQPPSTEYNKHLAPQLLPMGVAGLPGGTGSLTSDTTQLEGLVAGIDILPTVLRQLGIPRPTAVQGRPLRLAGERNAGSLQSLYNRWRVSTARRFTLILSFLLVWPAVVLLFGLLADRRGIRGAMRIGGLALLWTPTTALLSAAMRPSKPLEIVVVVGLAFVLGALNDRFVRWPRAPVVPCAVALIAFPVDLVRGSPLIVTSVYGSNPLFGSRFFGIGNELVASLTAMALIGIAAALPARPPMRRDLWVFVAGGLVLGVTMGAGVLGAKVGVVSAVGAGFATATVLMLRRGPSKKAILLALLTPVLALGALAGLDLATGGNGHFARNILKGGTFGQTVDEIGRRYHLAFNNLHHGVIPLDTAVCLLAIAFAIKYRKRILAPVAGSAAWRAGLAGVAASAVAGSLGNDSGPILLIVGIFGAACTIAYLRGDPRLAESPTPPPAAPPPVRAA